MRNRRGGIIVQQVAAPPAPKEPVVRTARRPVRSRSRATSCLLAAGALVGAVVLTACSEGDDGGGSADGGRIAGLLAPVPNTDVNERELVVIDWEAAAASSGVTVPDADAGDDAQLSYLVDLMRTTGALAPGAAGGTKANTVQGRLGFVPSQVTATVDAGIAPDRLSMATVTVGADTVLDAASSGIEGAQRSSIGGLDAVSWLDDNEIDPSLDTPFELQGQAGRVLALDDDLIAATSNDGTAGQVAGTASGEASSILERPGIADAAEVLDRHEVFAAYLSTDPTSGGRPRTQSEVDAAPSLLGSYTAYGLGNAWDDGEIRLVVAIAHGDEEDAEENLGRLRTLVAEGSASSTRPWSEVLLDAEISREGTTVVGRFRAEPGIWLQARQLLWVDAAG